MSGSTDGKQPAATTPDVTVAPVSVAEAEALDPRERSRLVGWDRFVAAFDWQARASHLGAFSAREPGDCRTCGTPLGSITYMCLTCRTGYFETLRGWYMEEVAAALQAEREKKKRQLATETLGRPAGGTAEPDDVPWKQLDGTGLRTLGYERD